MHSKEFMQRLMNEIIVEGAVDFDKEQRDIKSQQNNKLPRPSNERMRPAQLRNNKKHQHKIRRPGAR